LPRGQGEPRVTPCVAIAGLSSQRTQAPGPALPVARLAAASPAVAAVPARPKAVVVVTPLVRNSRREIPWPM